MDYDDAIRWLRTLPDFERTGDFSDRPDLAPVRALLTELGDPHLHRATMHIAGSKAKGSTGVIAEAILRATGACTGFYVSPHLHRYNERIRIEAQPIERQAFGSAMSDVRDAMERLSPKLPGREFLAFDALTAAAFVAFRSAGVDVQIVEVGLGGLLDSTNVFGAGDTPHVVVITPISLEHTAILGATIPAIAAQKAAIITADATVVVAPQRESALDVIRERARSQSAKLIEVPAACRMTRGSASIDGQDFKLQTQHEKYAARLPLAGRHQLDNAATAIVACEELQQLRGDAMTPEQVRRGLADVVWPGRLEVLKRKPLVIVDGAHNGDSTKRLAAALQDDFHVSHALVLFGTLADKDVAAMAFAITPIADHIFAPSWPNQRAAPADLVAHAFREDDIPVSVWANVPDAYEAAAAQAGDRGAIVAFGSLAFVAALREYLLGIESDIIRLALTHDRGAPRAP
jgi:dihydrofolate synthase/folylpolyglutamate synthase